MKANKNMKIEYKRIDDILPYQKNAGITVIPTLQWAEKDENATKIWYDGMDEAIRRIKPSRVLVYGGNIGYKYPDGIEVKYYDNKAFKN